MITGTFYFPLLSMACNYYGPYGYTEQQVRQKVFEGEITIGKPPVNPGEKLLLIDKGTRYAIESP